MLAIFIWVLFLPSHLLAQYYVTLQGQYNVTRINQQQVVGVDITLYFSPTEVKVFGCNLNSAHYQTLPHFRITDQFVGTAALCIPVHMDYLVIEALQDSVDMIQTQDEQIIFLNKHRQKLLTIIKSKKVVRNKRTQNGKFIEQKRQSFVQSYNKTIRIVGNYQLKSLRIQPTIFPKQQVFYDITDDEVIIRGCKQYRTKYSYIFTYFRIEGQLQVQQPNNNCNNSLYKTIINMLNISRYIRIQNQFMIFQNQKNIPTFVLTKLRKTTMQPSTQQQPQQPSQTNYNQQQTDANQEPNDGQQVQNTGQTTQQQLENNTNNNEQSDTAQQNANQQQQQQAQEQQAQKQSGQKQQEQKQQAQPQQPQQPQQGN